VKKREEAYHVQKRPLNLLLGSVLIAATLIFTPIAHAALGGSADSIASDQKALSALRRAPVVRNGFTIQTVESDSTSVREYVSPSGVVFGIAWNGMVHPDLTQLLGSYTSEYQDALPRAAHGPDRRRLQLRTDRIVVEKWGHMRNLQGRAYAPALVPLGVSIDEIK
jgi:hypothetical protein